jgi:hypothetical protein
MLLPRQYQSAMRAADGRLSVTLAWSSLRDGSQSPRREAGS